MAKNSDDKPAKGTPLGPWPKQFRQGRSATIPILIRPGLRPQTDAERDVGKITGRSDG